MKFPAYETLLKPLVEQHLELKNEPIVLAIYYNVPATPDDVYLLEVVETFGLGTVSDEGDFFETVFGPAAAFPVADGGHLHLLLTNPVEFMYARDLKWPAYLTLKQAINRGEYKVLYRSATNLVHEQFIGWLEQPEEIAA